jgi:hypothetical protein
LLGEDILGAKKRNSFRRPPVTPFLGIRGQRKKKEKEIELLVTVRASSSFSPAPARDLFIFIAAAVPRRARDGGEDREARQHRKKKLRLLRATLFS